MENSKGVLVDGYQTAEKDKNLIAWNLVNQLPSDGSLDGMYTIKIKAVDKDGIIKEQTLTFFYDSKVPALTSITPADGSVFTTAPTQIVVKATDVNGSGIDFATSRASMKLMIGTKEITNIVRIDNGVDTMTFSLPILEDKGNYTASIKLRDRAGNENSYSTQFDYVDKTVDLLPEVVSTTIAVSYTHLTLPTKRIV